MKIYMKYGVIALLLKLNGCFIHCWTEIVELFKNNFNSNSMDGLMVSKTLNNDRKQYMNEKNGKGSDTKALRSWAVP